MRKLTLTIRSFTTTLIALLCSFMPAALAQESTDEQGLVNERLPYTARDMEQMWKLDCTQIIAVILAGPDTERADSTEALPPSLRTQLDLCGYIYNDRERRFFRQCPDYRGAYQLLETQQFILDEELLDALTEKLTDCPQPDQ
ncbi:hypothetical protein [Microbulbifer marinus]|uniref:hypothetical protein n=1 Tax=Microbulbifer marinus TaxID=658218 RepID=UPI001115342B|nr:hypothetical protein [Microbulbifer marinus]